jgi:hypothetical protein
MEVIILAFVEMGVHFSIFHHRLVLVLFPSVLYILLNIIIH